MRPMAVEKVRQSAVQCHHSAKHRKRETAKVTTPRQVGGVQGLGTNPTTVGLTGYNKGALNGIEREREICLASNQHERADQRESNLSHTFYFLIDLRYVLLEHKTEISSQT